MRPPHPPPRRPGTAPRRIARTALRLLCATAAVLSCSVPAAAVPADIPAGTQCNLPATGLDPSRPWAQQRLDFERVWPLTRGGGVIVGVVDTGVDSAQPFLRGHVLPGPDVINHSGTADTDCVGHGTLIAGLIAGQPLPGFAFAGVAPDADILPVRQANTTSDGTAATLADSIRAAVDGGAKVINVSVTTEQPTLDLADAVHYALAHDVVVVAAAGNDFQSGNSVEFPAAFPGVLSVGAVDTGGNRASFSYAGAAIAVVAPGTDITGPGAGGDGLVTGANGTSYATPFVSGVAALVRAYHPELTEAQVVHRIEATADHPPGALPNPELGWGEVNPYNAVTAVLPEEHGATPVPVSAAISPAHPVVPPPDSTGRTAALIAAGAVAASAVAWTAAWTVRRGRSRGWAPGRWRGWVGSELDDRVGAKG